MKNQKIDRRVQRTRELLSHALMSLIKEKGYEAVTVQNIIDRANLGRSTFYAHYQDKEDLLMRSIEEVIHHLVRGMDTTTNVPQETISNRQLISVLPMFKHAEKTYDFHKALLTGRGANIILKAIQAHLSLHLEKKLALHLSAGHTPTIPLNIVAHHFAGTLLNLMVWWLEQNMPYPPERMAEIFQGLTMPSIWEVLGGLEPIEMDVISN